MKSWIRGSRFIVLIAAVALTACSDSTGVTPFDVSVDVRYPTTYAATTAAGARVVLRSLERSTADTAVADAAGTARFTSVIPGSYEVSASRSLTEDESLELTGNRAVVELNAVQSSIQLSAATSNVVLDLSGSAVGSFVFREVYYTGSSRPSGGTYFFDQFYEIYNNATDTLYAGGLLLVNVHGVSGQINPSSAPTPFQDDDSHVYADEVWRIPGGPEDHPVPPGGSIVIAQQGIDHRSDANGNPGSPVDLGDADWEMYVEASGNDIDSPAVPNMELVHKRGGFYALFSVFGPAVAIARVDAFSAADSVAIPGSSPTTPPVLRIPVGAVIDAVEALQNPLSGSFKRLPAALDAGFVSASGTYTGEGFRRHTEATIAGRPVLRDTNNGANDFELVSTPAPRGF